MSRERIRAVLSVGVGLACGVLLVLAATGLLDSEGDSTETAQTAGTTSSEEATVAQRSAGSSGGRKSSRDPKAQMASRGAEGQASRRSRPRRPRFQRSADFEDIRPTPRGKQARGDRGAIWDRGCMMLPEDTRSGRCVFGKRRSKRTVVLFGDSHAMHFFGMMNRTAKHLGWRLVGLVKAGCPPYDTPVYNGKVGGEYKQCQKWHRNSLRRIKREKPRMIFTGGALVHKAMRDGQIIQDGRRNRTALRRGYQRMLKRLDRFGRDVVAFQDLPMAPHDMTDCVGAHHDRLRKCAYRKRPRYGKSFEVRAAASVPGVQLINLSPGLCRSRVCFGVIRNRLVYRDDDHMTATFARTLAPWLVHWLRRWG